MKHGLALALLFCLAGCSGAPGGAVSGDAEPRDNGDAIRVDLNLYTPGTIPQGIGEPVEEAANLAREWQAQRNGPGVKYQILVNTGSSEGEWLKTQLIGGIAPEIVSLNAEVVWPDVDKGWFVPLDEFLERPNPYVPGNSRWMDTFTNQALMGAKRAPDGKLYCISIDIVETGIFYNKTIFKSLGIDQWPDTWEGMRDAFDKVAEAGIIPMTSPWNLASDWGQDIVFELLYHDIIEKLDLIPSRADAEGYLGHYLDASEAGFLTTKGFFTSRDPRWREMNRIIKDWRRYWSRELKNSDPVRLFLTQRVAAFWNGSWFIRRMATDRYVDFEWDVAYIPTITRETSPFGSGTPSTVIGGAAVQLHVTNSAILNDNLEDCIDYLMFITAPQHIERLAKEALVYIPNVNGAEMDERLAPFQEIFQRRYCSIKWLESMDGEYKKNWRRMLDFFLNDGVELDGFLQILDENFADWVESHRGDAAWDFDAMEKAWKPNEEALLRELDPVS